MSRFFLGALILSKPVLDVIRRELRRVSPDVKIETEQIENVLSTEVLKREVLDGEKATEARKKIARSATKLLRKISKEGGAEVSARTAPPAAASGQSTDEAK